MFHEVLMLLAPAWFALSVAVSSNYGLITVRGVVLLVFAAAWVYWPRRLLPGSGVWQFRTLWLAGACCAGLSLVTTIFAPWQLRTVAGSLESVIAVSQLLIFATLFAYLPP